jgi:hypothetical protein
MSWSSARASIPDASISFERGLSSDPKSSVSLGSKSFSQNPSVSVTLNGFAKPRAFLMSSLVSIAPSGAVGIATAVPG